MINTCIACITIEQMIDKKREYMNPPCLLVAFCAFAWLVFCALGAFLLLVLLVRAKSFSKKNKGFKTALITLFILFLLLGCFRSFLILIGCFSLFQLVPHLRTYHSHHLWSVCFRDFQPFCWSDESSFSSYTRFHIM